MIVIPIESKTHGLKHVFIDGEDFDLFNKYNWYINKVGDRFYAVYELNKRKSLRLHRLITDCPNNMLVDHKDGNTLNNCRSNLRICTHKENNKNRLKRKISGLTSKYKGVHFDTSVNKFRARIFSNKKSYGNKFFKTEKEAAIEYNKLALEHHGEYARLNIIEDC